MSCPVSGLSSMNDVYNWIAGESASGAGELGDISTALLNAGLTIEAARMALTTISGNIGTDPQVLARVNAELNYLNTYGAQPTRNTWVVPVLIVAAVVLLIMNERK